ncbi:MAG TPA: IMP cyclohydrolase [Candidatus Hydrogenedentes bacterium]|nr:IMP cyclohydrolase [Candidatus Hydrogenedentota bacterium]HQH51062.1 IMP cyclohydrolase [Candidatus Hydrogenedentota bacterium]HQM47696.1 IMP cyclohydrolase [Candidatus Hydrogenedentota bacterium]
MTPIKRAIISCHDKTGLVELVRLLTEFNVEIVSTAGTLHALEEAGLHPINMADFTGVEEMMDGRVKSLHAKIHAGLLGIRDNKLHAEQLQAHGYEWIDLVAVNLRPLESLIRQPGVTPEEVIEQIDIGGMSMIRSAAKNFRYVGVLVNPERYTRVMHELRALGGALTFETRHRLAQEAFACAARYDQMVADYLKGAESAWIRE